MVADSGPPFSRKSSAVAYELGFLFRHPMTYPVKTIMDNLLIVCSLQKMGKITTGHRLQEEDSEMTQEDKISLFSSRTWRPLQAIKAHSKSWAPFSVAF